MNNGKYATIEAGDHQKFSSLLQKLTYSEVPSNDDLQEHEHVLQSTLDYVNTAFESSEYSYLTNHILPTLLNYSDRTALVPCLIKTDYPKALLKWLSAISKQGQSEDVRYIVGMIYNISRHDDGIQALNSLDTTDRIKEIQTHNNDQEINILCSMIIALLSTSEQIKNDRKRMNNILDQLLQIVVDASKRPPRYLAGGWHISEPLIVLIRLICYERTLDYILQHAQVEFGTSSTTEFFINILLKFHKEISEDDRLKLSTCTALCNILWSISLRPQYKQELQENEEFKILIEKIATDKVITNSAQYVPKYIENIQKAADGILCNISDNNQVNIPSVTEDERCKSLVSALIPSMLTNNKPSIMISYAHNDNNICTQLYNELAKHNQQFDIWIDWKNSKTGYLWGKIADGIANSSVILCLLSNKYYESKSCQQEFVYAHDHLKKPVIPIYIFDDKPPGWLAIHTCIMKYVRFRNIKQLEQDKLKDLIEMIEENLSGTSAKTNENLLSPHSAPVHHELLPVAQKPKEELKLNASNKEMNSGPKTDLSRKSIEHWDKSDIKQWFQENKISIDLYKLYQFEDGTQLLSYAASLSNDEKIELHRQIYSDEFAEMYRGKRLLPHQFTAFAYALRKLSSEQVKTEMKQTVNHSAIQKTAETNRSRMCEIL
ncbi:unnamed protein product [Rotaria sordida]|uniref:TIR domain-containing protein n=1 Tax=Rotaria sordida TaxID=392033 RepID=A0A813W9I2_9BILA|nr:unnamed protein product [Rotaria sordida]CAF0857786.1 unnamed protein product [Rotaria sordida]CAF3766281.1 unnamed protein product [Rotaria sordida]CAF3786282.1 unnamed protein product [Rotaria sordida]